MKKIFMVFILLVTVSLSFAQHKPHNGSDKKKKTDFIGAGVIGLNYSGISGHDGTDVTYKDIFGLQLGIIINVLDFTQHFGLRAEANFSMMGGQYDYGTDKETVHLNYLNLPIVTRYQDPSGFFGEAGLQSGFLLSAKLKTNSGSQDYKDYVKSFDFGIPLGVGYEFKNHIGVGLRIVPGVADISKNSTVSHHNFVGTLRASYSF